MYDHGRPVERKLQTFTLAKLTSELRERSRHAIRPAREVVRQRRLSESELAELLAAYADGIGTIELAQRFGVHRDAVRRHLSRAGVLRPRESLTAEQVQLAIELREHGLLYREIGEGFGVAKDTVRVSILRTR